MNGNINGWSVISRHLQLREKNQSDLARLLDISPAAITQIKNGQFRLNSRQMYVIPAYLEFSSEACNEFFTEILNSRMQYCHGHHLNSGENCHYSVKVERLNCHRKIPLASVESLKNYVPALEKMEDFLRRVSFERCACSCRNGSAALKIEKNGQVTGSAGNRLLIIDDKAFPRPGASALAAWDDGTLAMGTIDSSGGKNELRLLSSSRNDLMCRPREALRWIHPVLQVLPVPVL